MNKNKLLVMGLAMTTAISMPVLAATSMKDSIASVDMTDKDSNNTVGYDETQQKNTEYYDEFTADTQQTCEVYATQASTFSVIIPKTIILNGTKGQENSGAYVVTVKGNIGGAEAVSVTPDAAFKMSQAGKADIDATVTQAMTNFMVTAANGVAGDATTTVYGVDETAGAVTNGKVEVANLSAGSWMGSFKFDIKIADVATAAPTPTEAPTV